MKIIDIGFREAVKLPGGVSKNTQRLFLDHPETPNKDVTMRYDDVSGFVVLTHVRTSATVLVPLSNVAWMRGAVEPSGQVKK